MATKKTSKKTHKSTPKAPKVLVVARKDGVSLMKTFGFTAPQKLTNEKLLMRLRKVSQYMDAFDGTLAGSGKTLAAAIIAAGDNISIDGDGPTVAKPKTNDKKTNDKKTDGKKTDGKKTIAKKSVKRIDCVCAMLKKLPTKGASVEQVAKLANQMYVKAGGDDNVKQTVHHLRVILPTLKNFGIVKIEKGRIFPSE